MLTFLGYGSCFNTELGNTAAFYKDTDKMLLIDCGGDVFSKLIKYKILEDVKNLYIVITHLHDDHCGSLTSLLYYMNFYKKIKPVIILPVDKIENKQYIQSLLSFIKIQGAEKFVNYQDESSGSFLINFIENTHVSQLQSFSLSFKINNKNIYYSGDTSEFCKKPNLYDYIYQEIAFNYSEVHFYYEHLKEYNLFREKIYLMHIDDMQGFKALKQKGYKIPKLVGGKKWKRIWEKQEKK